MTAKRERVLEATHAHFRQIAEQINTRIGSNGPVALQISHRVAALPGLSKELEQQIDCQIIELEREAAARGAVRHGEHLVQGGKGVRFVTSVPWSLDSASPISTKTPGPDPTSTAQTAVPAAAASPVPPPPPPRPRLPSHAVVHGIAHPLNHHDTRLDALIGLPAGSDAATIIDGVAVFGIGDRITLPDGEELLLIEVAGENGA
ncbi:MAG: hypothetical protein P8X53_07960 [Chromatiales bacterium]